MKSNDASGRSSSMLVTTHSVEAKWWLQDDMRGGLQAGIDAEFVKTVLGGSWTSRWDTVCICFELGSKNERSRVLIGKVEIDVRHSSRRTKNRNELMAFDSV